LFQQVVNQALQRLQVYGSRDIDVEPFLGPTIENRVAEDPDMILKERPLGQKWHYFADFIHIYGAFPFSFG
jgi:hypothetical protein